MPASFVRLAAIAGVLLAAGTTTSCSGHSPSAPSTPPAGPATPSGPGGITAVMTMTPQPGSTAGGSSVRIEWVGVQSGASVTIGGLVVRTAFLPGTLFLITPPHAAGTVDVVVTNPDGASSSLPGGYTYAPPDTFDFNGEWLGSPHETPIHFTIRNDTLVSLSCGGLVAALATPLPQVIGGEFSATAEGVAVTGRIVSGSAATGTIDMSSCPATTWYAFKH